MEERKIEESNKDQINIEVKIKKTTPSIVDKNNYIVTNKNNNLEKIDKIGNKINIIDETEIRSNIDKHLDNSATDRRFIDITYRNYIGNIKNHFYD
jgi:hypothetical protein